MLPANAPLLVIEREDWLVSPLGEMPPWLDWLTLLGFPGGLCWSAVQGIGALRPRLAFLLPGPIPEIAVSLFICVAAYGVLAFRKRRSGRAEFFEDRVAVSARAGAPVDIPWADLTGYCDEASDWIALMSREAPVSLSVPASTAHERAAVLAFLDRKGVRRRER
jgi:hypothetical protein